MRRRYAPARTIRIKQISSISTISPSPKQKTQTQKHTHTHTHMQFASNICMFVSKRETKKKQASKRELTRVERAREREKKRESERIDRKGN